MKKQLLKSALIAVAGVGLMAGSASAVLVTAAYTGDNIIDTYYLQDGEISQDLSAGPNRSDWTKADFYSKDLIAGHSYSFIWQVSNDLTSASMSDSNPAGFLGEIDFGGNTNYFSDVTWKYAIKYPNTPTSNFNLNWVWNEVTTYGYNGEAGIIWTNVLGGAVAGISTDAQWIWSANNSDDGDYELFIRADFTAVPEPTTMLLFGSGLLGLAAVARRKKS